MFFSINGPLCFKVNMRIFPALKEYRPTGMGPAPRILFLVTLPLISVYKCPRYRLALRILGVEIEGANLAMKPLPKQGIYSDIFADKTPDTFGKFPMSGDEIHSKCTHFIQMSSESYISHSILKAFGGQLCETRAAFAIYKDHKWSDGAMAEKRKGDNKTMNRVNNFNSCATMHHYLRKHQIFPRRWAFRKT